MKRCLIELTAAVSMLAATPMAALAQHLCDSPSGLIDRKACAKAAEGPDALRRFVSRTQALWNLYYWDYARRDEQDMPGVLATSKPAPAAASSRRSEAATNGTR
jgi:hypothetical protein